MTTAIAHDAPAQPSSLAAVPRAIWIALGALALATAGLSGALVMRAVEAPAAPAPVAQVQPAQPQAPAQQQAAAAPPLASQLQAAAQPAPAPQVQQAPRPAPAPKPVQRAAAPAQPAPVAEPRAPLETTRAAICASCGTIESVQAVQEKGDASGLGAVGGAVVGGLLGNQVGGGNGKRVMTVVGAAGGAFAGHEVEKRMRATTAYDVQVRMEDGSLRSFRRAEPMSVGTRVVVDGNALRIANRASAQPAPRAIHTGGST